MKKRCVVISTIEHTLNFIKLNSTTFRFSKKLMSQYSLRVPSRKEHVYMACLDAPFSSVFALLLLSNAYKRYARLYVFTAADGVNHPPPVTNAIPIHLVAPARSTIHLSPIVPQNINMFHLKESQNKQYKYEHILFRIYRAHKQAADSTWGIENCIRL